MESRQRAVEAPAAAVLLGEHAGCMQLAWRDPRLELYLAVAEDDLASVITKRTRVRAEGEVAAAELNEGLWLAPGAPVTIDLDAKRPRVRLKVRGMDASGTVAPEVVGTTFQLEPFVAGPEERTALTFDHALPLFVAPDRGAFAVVNMNVGVMELADGELQLPMSYIATFTVEEVGRSGEWVEVIVRGGDGSYELRGLTPAFAVRPLTPYFLASPYAGTVEVPAGTELYDARDVIVGRTIADGLYQAGDEPGEVRVETPWGSIEVRTDAVSREP